MLCLPHLARLGNEKGLYGRRVNSRPAKKEYGPPFERVLQALSIGRLPAVEEVLPTKADEVLGFLQQSGRFQEEHARLRWNDGQT